MNLNLNRRHFLAMGAAATALPFTSRLAMAQATPFTFQASWINDAEFAGYFAAIDKGFYKDEGLDLTYLSGGPDVIPESALIARVTSSPFISIKACGIEPAKTVGSWSSAPPS